MSMYCDTLELSLAWLKEGIFGYFHRGGFCG